MSAQSSPSIHVLAGVNGAGKSSIGGQFARGGGSQYFNPDEAAKKIMTIHPAIRFSEANAQAWTIGKQLLERSIKEQTSFAFEITLGGNTITRLLEQAARDGHHLHIWFAGLDSPERHIQRVQSRVALGGHDIPEEKIRERWTRSRENLIRLMPLIHHLRVYDNSREADPARGKRPVPELLLEMRQGKITAPADLSNAPDWAKPLIVIAIKLQRARK